MALFGSARDVSLIRHVNRELINKIIDTEVVVYKIALSETKANIYGESLKKIFYDPVRIACLVDREDKGFSTQEDNLNYARNATFSFLRDDLWSLSLVIEAGDVIEWDNSFYELNLVSESQLWTGRNPNTLLTTTVDQNEEFGYQISVFAKGFKITPEKLNLKNIRSGINENFNNLSSKI